MIILIKLTGIQGNIVYNDIDIDKNIRRSFEDCLQDKYGELAINQFGIPVEAPSEIPRILIVSQKFNFQLQISKNMLQVNVPFNLNVDGNPVQYLQSTVDGMKTLLILFKEFKAEILYVGVMANYVSNIDNGVNHILSKCYNTDNLQDKDNIYDIMSRITYVEDDIYYKNMTIGNIRETISQDNLVGISYDVNDRYRYNSTKQISASRDDTLDKILSIHKRFIDDDYGRLLK